MTSTERPLLVSLVLVAAATVMPARLRAQSVDQVATVPPNVLLANYDNVPVGPFGGLEGSAYVARVSDPSAAWFNPAGLSRETNVQISGSAGVYQWTAVSPRALPNSGGSVQQLPNFVGFTFHVRDGLTAGAALLTTHAWTQEIDSELNASVPTGQERFAYSADSDVVRRVAAVGAGYHRPGPWRVGAGFAFSLVDLRLVQGISDRIVENAALHTLLVVAHASGSALQLRTQGGVQYDTARLRLGAAVRTPALTIRREGTLTLDGTLDLGAAALGASLYDANARFQSPVPWELQTGVAYVGNRAEIEVDLQGYTPISAHSLLDTQQPTRVYGDLGAGGLPTVISQPFGGLTSVSDGVINMTVGGHVRPIHDRDLRVHGGFATSRSPVGDGDQVFNKVDLTSWSFGVSGTYLKLRFAVGFNRRVGTSRDLLVRNLLNSDPLHTNIDVRSGGLIYSISYQF